MIQEQAVAAVIIGLNSEKNKSRKKRKKKKCVKPWLKRRKNLEFYETLLADLWLEEYNYNILLWMTSENSEEIFQLLKDDTPTENTKLRELILPRLWPAATIGFLLEGKLYKSYGYEYYSS